MRKKLFFLLILSVTGIFMVTPAFGLEMGSVTSSSVVSKETAYYTVTVSYGDGGSVFPNGSNRLKEGSSRFYTITPNAGFIVSDVKVNGTSIGAVSGYRISNIQEDTSLEVIFGLASPDSESVSSESLPDETSPQTEVAKTDINPKTVAC